MIAYTVGNPDTYDQILGTEPASKSSGGVIYRTMDDAVAVLEPHGGLPPEWFDGKQLPGAVYELLLPADFDWFADVEDAEYGLALRRPVIIGRKVTEDFRNGEG